MCVFKQNIHFGGAKWVKLKDYMFWLHLEQQLEFPSLQENNLRGQNQLFLSWVSFESDLNELFRGHLSSVIWIKLLVTKIVKAQNYKLFRITA